MYDSYMEKDPMDHSSYKPGFIGSVILFSILVAVNGISILVFPIVLPVLPWGIMICRYELKGSYMANIYNEYNLVWKVTSNEKRDEYDAQDAFVTFLAFYFFASFIILFFGACFSLGNFTNMVVLGAISNAIIILISAWALHDTKMKCITVRHALGGKITCGVIRKLERMYPRGFDVDRIQFLLHDTLKQRLGNNANIRSLLHIFPGSLYTPDDEGHIPFRLACQYSSVEVVSHMVGLDNDLLNICDKSGNTVMHYACRGNNYKVINYLLNRHMILAVTRNFDGNLPVYILCSSELVHTCCPTPPIHPHRLFVDSGARVYSNYGKDAPNPQHLETVMRLLLAYPEDMQEKLQAASPSKEEVVVLSTPALMELASSTEHEVQIKPQKHIKLLIYIILVVVNMAAAVYIGTLQTLSNTNQMRYHSEVKKLVDELIASQNEMNMLRSRMEVLKHASEGHSHSMLKVF